jgi:hypothetical protein
MISNANDNESRPDANAPAFQAGKSPRPSESKETIIWRRKLRNPIE